MRRGPARSRAPAAPDVPGSRFVVTEQNTEIYNPQRLQVWRVARDTLGLEWGLTPDSDSWIPDSVRWLSNSAFRYVRASPPDAPEVWRPDTARLNPGSGWSAARP